MHPNATAAGLSGGAATGLVWLLNRFAHTHLNAYDTGLIATGLAAVVLWVGRRGVSGALSDLWHGVAGGGKPPPAPPAAPVAE